MADILFANAPRRVSPAGRPRTAITVPDHGDMELTDLVFIRVMPVAEGVTVVPPEKLTPGRSRGVRVHLMAGSAVGVSELPDVPVWAVLRNQPTNPEILAKVHPPAVARAVADALAGATP